MSSPTYQCVDAKFFGLYGMRKEKKKKGKTRENNEKKHESQAKSVRLGISGYDSHYLSVWLGISWRGAGMAQLRERSPPTSVARVRFVVLVSCGLSLLLVLVLAPRVFLWVLRFSSLHKNQHFQISSGITGRRASLWRRHCNKELNRFLLFSVLNKRQQKTPNVFFGPCFLEN